MVTKMLKQKENYYDKTFFHWPGFFNEFLKVG